MSPVTLSSLLAVFVASSAVMAQTTTPLADKHFDYPNGIPYQADSDDGVRGRQQGYNICNSTTENQNSMCQTSFLNHIDDFCLWSAPTPNSLIGDTEGEEVAWCTKKGHGTRLIPAGALTGVQYLRAPGYVQVVGFIDQTQINLVSNDTGGELDPHGADLRGNPLGGLVYSNAFASNNGNNGTYQQVIEWHNFMGSNSFCFKACDPAGPNAAQLCQHIYDRVGVQYNCPNQAQNGVFEVCDSENQDPPGIFTENGVVMTYSQPPESLGPITSIPYTPRMPASSNCVPFSSAALYTSLPPGTTSAASSSAAPTSGAASGSVQATGSHTSATRSGSSSSPSATGANSNGAGAVRVSSLAGVLGVAFAVVFLS